MIKVNVNDRIKIGHLFKNLHDTAILSCLQGHMGRAWTDNTDNPACALIRVGDFCFLAGEESTEAVNELITHILDLTGLHLAFVITDKKILGDRIEATYGDDCKKIQRYGIKKKQDEFDLEYLRSIVKRLPKEYTLYPINDFWYDESLREEWSEDFVSNFLSKEDYINRGIGRIITHNGKIISGASSYSIYKDGIEIEIGTREDYRRQGLALIAGAALILACHEKGLYPNWDAASMISVQLAQKLGYEYDKPYDTYMLRKKA